MSYLVDHPPQRSQYRSPRRSEPSGVAVVHTAENAPDFVAFDGGAEAVARFIRGRSDPGSYHDLVDSDSAINLVPYDAEAYHDGTGSNPHSYGVSVATRADVWPLAPASWRAGAVSQAAAAAARYARWLRAHNGIVIPARRITRAESERRVPGFITHAERDPARRRDPGAGFPFDDFLEEFARLSAGRPAEPTPVQEDTDTMLHIIKGDKSAEWWATDFITKRHVRTVKQAASAIWLTAATGGRVSIAAGGQAHVLPQSEVDSIPTAGVSDSANIRAAVIEGREVLAEVEAITAAVKELAGAHA